MTILLAVTITIFFFSFFFFSKFYATKLGVQQLHECIWYISMTATQGSLVEPEKDKHPNYKGEKF